MDTSNIFTNLEQIFTTHWEYYEANFCKDFFSSNYEAGSPTYDITSFTGNKARITMTTDFTLPYEYVKSTFWGWFYKNVITDYTVEQHYQKKYGVYCLGDTQKDNCITIAINIQKCLQGDFDIKDYYTKFNEFYSLLRYRTNILPHPVNKFLWYPYGWNSIRRLGDEYYFIVRALPFCIVTENVLEEQRKFNKPFELVKIDKK